MELHQKGRVGEKRAVNMEQAAPGSGYSPELLELGEQWDTALSHRVWAWGGPLWGQGLGSMVLEGPFQPGIFCGFI